MNKTQPKAPLPQEGFGMNLFVSFSLSLEWFLGLLSLGIWFITVLRGRRKISFRVFGTPSLAGAGWKHNSQKHRFECRSNSVWRAVESVLTDCQTPA